MNLKDNIPNLNIKGIVTVELKDATTGEIVHKETKHNFIALPAKSWAVYQALNNVMPSTNFPSNTIYMVHPRPFQVLFLSGDTSPEEPLVETFAKWPFVGFAGIGAGYSGDSPFRGTLNLSESVLEKDKMRFVFDFPTNAGNGAFQSLGFMSLPEDMPLVTTDAFFPPTQGMSYITGRTAYTGVGDICIIGDLMYRIYGTTLYSTPLPLVFPVVWTTVGTLAYNFSYTGCCAYQDKIYATRNSGTDGVKVLRILNLDGMLFGTIMTSIPDLIGVASNGDGSFWVSSESTLIDASTGKKYQEYFYKVNSSGVTIDKIPINYENMNAGTYSRGKVPTATNGRGAYLDMYKGMLLAAFRDEQSAYPRGYPLTFYNLTTKEIVFQGNPRNLNQNIGIYAYGISCKGDDIYYNYYMNTGTASYYMLQTKPIGLSSRVLLANPVLKQNTQTLKVTYDLMFDPIW